MKRCGKCGETKSVLAFSARKAMADGLQTHCRQCNKAYRGANRKAIQVKDRARWAGERRAHRLNVAKQRRRDDPQPFRDADAARYLVERDKRIAWAKAYAPIHRAMNPESHRSSCIRYQNRLTMHMSPIDIAKTNAYKRRIRDLPCYYCGEAKEEMQDDHFFPLSRGGTDHWFNIVRACAPCNQSKGARLGSEYERIRG